MADPLSIAASIIALLQAGSAIAQGLDRIISAKNAEYEIRLLQDEANRLIEVVSIIQRHLDHGARLDPSTEKHLVVQLQGAEATALALRNAVENKLVKEKTGKASFVKFFWHDLKGEIKRFHRALEKARINVDGALALAYFTTLTTHSVEMRVRVVQETIKDKEDEPNGNSTTVAGREVILPAYEPARVPINGTTNTVTGPNSMMATNDWTAFDLSVRFKNTCPVLPCPCRCHKMQVVHWPQAFNTVLGSFSMQYRSLPWLSSECDQEQCAKQTTDFHIQHRFPRWLFHGVAVLKLTPFAMTPGLVLRVYHEVIYSHSPILQAFFSGNVARIKSVLLTEFERGRSSQCLLESSTGDSRCVLGYGLNQAAAVGNWDAFRLGLQLGCDPLRLDSSEMSPYLYYWSWLLRDGIEADIHYTEPSMMFDEDSMKFSPLHMAILERGEETFEEALQHTSRADINAKDAFGATALSWAVERGTDEQIMSLLNKGADPDVAGDVINLPIVRAIYNFRPDLVELLLNSGADPNRQVDGTPFIHHLCVRQKDWVESLDLLLGRGMIPDIRNSSGETALAYMLVHIGRTREPVSEYKDTIDWMLAHDVQAERNYKQGTSALQSCVMFNFHGLMRSILESGKEETWQACANGWTLLHEAAAYGDETTLKILQEYPIHIDSDLDFDAGEGYPPWSAMNWADMRHSNEARWQNMFYEEKPVVTTDSWYEEFQNLYKHLKDHWREWTLTHPLPIRRSTVEVLKLPGTFPSDD